MHFNARIALGMERTYHDDLAFKAEEVLQVGCLGDWDRHDCLVSKNSIEDGC